MVTLGRLDAGQSPWWAKPDNDHALKEGLVVSNVSLPHIPIAVYDFSMKGLETSMTSMTLVPRAMHCAVQIHYHHSRKETLPKVSAESP